MVKTFKAFLPWNQWNTFNNTWYVASGTADNHNLLKLLPIFWHSQILQLWLLLAHLSLRLIGELIVYQWSGVCRPSSSTSTMLKHLLRNRLADQSQILCGPSLGRGNDILFAASGSHDQDGRHAHIWSKPFKNLLLQNRQADFHETWYVASGTPAHHSLFK